MLSVQPEDGRAGIATVAGEPATLLLGMGPQQCASERGNGLVARVPADTVDHLQAGMAVEKCFIDGAEQFLAGDDEGFAVVGDIDFEQAAAALACGW